MESDPSMDRRKSSAAGSARAAVEALSLAPEKEKMDRATQLEQQRISDTLDRKNADAWTLLHGQPPHPNALNNPVEEEEIYYFNKDTGESSRIGPSRKKVADDATSQLTPGEPWWETEKTQQIIPIPNVVKSKKKKKMQYGPGDVQRIPEYQVSYMGLVNKHGSYYDAREKLGQSVRTQKRAHVVEKEAKVPESKLDIEQLEMLRLSATTGKPTLNSVVNRTKWQSFFQTKDYWHNDREESQALQYSFKHGEFTLTDHGLTKLPLGLCNTLTLQMGNLVALRLPRNKLVHVPSKMWKFLISLEELDLRYNQIEKLSKGVRVLTRLQELKLDFNHVHQLPATMTELVSLKSIKMTENWLEVLPDNFGHMPALEVLELSNNRIRMLPPSFHKLQWLHTLNLNNNQLTTLAIIKAPHAPDVPTQEDLESWERVVNEISGDVVYYNNSKDQTSNCNPFKEYEDMQNDKLWVSIEKISKQFSLPVAQRQGREVLAQDLIDTIAEFKAAQPPGVTKEPELPPVKRNERRRALAQLGLSEWEALVDRSIGSVYFKNNVTGESDYGLPHELDLFGEIYSLKVLRLSHNSLRTLPESMVELRNLHTFECSSNNLQSLPDGLGENMPKLKSLSFATNEIEKLPTGIVGMTALTKLNFTSNFVNEIPWAFCSSLKSLEFLYMQNNRVEKLPNSFRYMTHLKTLQIEDNPIKFPSKEQVIKGRDHIFWACRDQFYNASRGPPPKVHKHRYGIAGEIQEPWPAFKKGLQKYYAKAEHTHSLELLWKHLTEFPDEIKHLTMIKQLRMTGHSFHSSIEQPISVGTLTKLTELVLNCCHMHKLGDDIGKLKKLERVSMQDNKLECLPESFCKLRKLHTLNLSNNHLAALPESFGNLTSLTELHLDVNKLEWLPDSFGSLCSLEWLTCTHNKLQALPSTLSAVFPLKRIYVNANQIDELPEDFDMMQNLEDLRIGYNKISELPESMGESPTLQTSLKSLWLFNNQMVELPHNIVKLAALETLRLDNNPMRSPPIDLLSAGTATIMRYCRIRHARLVEIMTRLRNVHFEIQEENFTPKSENILVGNTGYLTLEDLAELDDLVDNYVNFQFYLHAPTGQEIIRWLTDRKAMRLYNFQVAILNELLAVIEEELKQEDPRFSDAVIDPYVFRSWGEGGLDINCYAIPAWVVKDDTPGSSEFVKDERPSLLKITYARLPQNPRFKYDWEAFAEAVHTFRGPYGMVAYHHTEEETVLFDRDERVDEEGFAIRLDPCELPAIVISKVIYTPDEAERKRKEMEMVARMVEDVKADVQYWLFTGLGSKMLKKEVARRKKNLKKLTRKRKKRFAELKVEVKKALEAVELVNHRKTHFDRKHVLPMHNFKNKDETHDLIEDTNRVMQQLAEKLRKCENSLMKCLHKKNWAHQEWVDEAIQDMKDKFVQIGFRNMLKRERVRARKKQWRRPWDGEDGADFIEWEKQRELLEEQAEDAGEEYQEDPEDDGKENGNFNWKGCELDDF
jgi:Leucine-rich repeat (LRR) protein